MFFYLNYCQAFYNIQTHHLPEALNYLQQAESINRQCQHSYFFLMIEYLYACYYTESKEYTKALNIFDTILSHTQTAGSYKSLLILQERAQLLALMGKNEEACQAYESLNTLKDSLDATNYIRQINTLHALYQIDKNELDNLNRQKIILYWSWLTISCIVIKALEEAYRMLTAKDHPVDRISVLSQLISVTKEKKDNQRLLKYIQEQENILHKHIAENPSLKEGFTDAYLFNELFYSYYYLNINAPEQTYPHLIKSKEYLNKNTYFTYRILYFDTLAQYNRAIGKYQQALNYIDTTLTMLKKNFPNDYAEQDDEKARIWKQVGQNEKAILFYEQALSLKDSVTTVLSNTQMKQIKKRYNIEKNELEQEKRNNRTQLLYLVFIFVILILLFIFMARLFMIRKALKHSEYEIRKAMEAVRQTNEMKNRFLSKMSYNIRTPLNNVVGFSQLIACEPNIDKETRQEYTNIIHQSSEKLMKLVNDVLDLSRLEAQMMKFQVQDYDVIELCKEVCYMARVQNEQTGINVDFSTEIDSPIIIHTDTRRLTLALLSALVYPQEHRQERNIRFILSREGDVLHFQINNSPLADPSFVSQETIIRHDINLLLLQHFGGNYFINQKTPENPEIVFIYPIGSESE